MQNVNNDSKLYGCGPETTVFTCSKVFIIYSIPKFCGRALNREQIMVYSTRKYVCVQLEDIDHSQCSMCVNYNPCYCVVKRAFSLQA